MERLKAFTVSWFFAPYIGSADLDFFKRIKDTNIDFDIAMVQRDIKDEHILDYVTNARFNTREIKADHKNPRTLKARQFFSEETIKFFDESRKKYDVLVSHSNELVSHAVAGEIKRKHPELPWVAYFGDLFAKNPYIKYIHGYPLVDEDRLTEEKTIIEADRIILNNPYQKELMFHGTLRKYEHKAVVIPHCYDPLMYDKIKKPISEKFIIGHLGTLYHVKRTAEPVLRAVDRLLEIYPHYKNTFEILFYGGSPCSHDVSVHAFMKNRNHVRFEDPISYMDSLRMMQNCDALLLIDGIFDKQEDDLDCNPFLAGKLADYMGAQRPIIGITMPKGPSYDILTASGNLVADLRIDRIAYVLKRYIDQKVRPDFDVYKQYACHNISQQMEAVFYSANREN
ncbi:hypothetical protein CAP48_05580 [Advenella sp. S44]|uniref:hypothetical protein n=1 Tax=Advenella sp. S44 TaxID=1982755 RepID=UPI000C2B31C1|nr:hypothetical protein [Advenella sp. S44]PJX25516.1 hypothetical protein CAP48_05580 [Advenella sp. S44]